MSIRMALATAAAAAALGGCSHQTPQSSAPHVSDKVFELEPGTIKVKAGIVGGELSHMKVTERVEDGTGRIDSGPRLSGRLVIRNLSSDQSVRVNGGRLIFADGSNNAIGLGPDSTPPAIQLSDSYNDTSARLDPGQELTRDVDVDFPGAALKPGKLHEIRMQLQYTAAPFKRDLLEFPVAVAAKQG